MVLTKGEFDNNKHWMLVRGSKKKTINNYTYLTVIDGEVLVYCVMGVSTFFQGDEGEVVMNVVVEAMRRKYLQRLETWEGDDGGFLRKVAMEAMGGAIFATTVEVGQLKH